MADNNPSQNKKLWKWKRKWKRKRRPENDAQQQNDCQREAVFREQKTTTLTVTFSSRPGPDQSSGRPGPDQSSGRPGSDQSSGRPGSDQSSSRPGPHQSSGRPGQDQYSSRPGSDQSSGRPGPDRSSGRPGPHQSCSRPGPDQSSGRPGPDQSSGRPGSDRSSSRPGPEHSQVYNDTIPQPQSQLAAVSDSSESESGESHTDSSRAPAAPPPPPPPPAAPAGPSSAQGRGQRPCSPSPAVVPSRCLAIDCEMVGAGPKGHISQLARCSIVSYDGDVIYDRFVLPPLPVTDYRTRWSGIRRSDLARATPYEVARKEILKLLWGKVLVGHAIHNDLKALNHSHPRALIRDTSRIPLLNTRAGFSEREMVSLKRLTKAIFNRDIQTGRKGHSSVEDAKATMELYRVVASEWEQKMAAERK